jgi:hypothetical protein
MALALESNGINSRRLLRASQYVQKQWLPINQELLKKIQTGLSRGVYELDVEFLIDDIKLDHGIFLTCLRGLGTLIRAESGEVPESLNPVELLHFSGYERLKAVLSDSVAFQSAHQLTQMNREQAACVQQSLISVSAVQSLLRERKNSPDTGYSAAILRQLGLALIAWNYPTVYRKAAAGSGAQSLEAGIVSQLGFSPQELAFQVLYSWGVCQNMQDVIFGSTRDFIDNADASHAVQEIVHLCEVGETLARACHPEVYPPQVKPWAEAKEVILSILGDSGLRLIQAQVLENAQAYLEYFPREFAEIKRINPDRCRSSVSAPDIPNAYSSHCSASVQTLLQEVYADMSDGNDKLAIAKLVQQVIPAAEFYGGAIFIVDPFTGLLVPRVHIKKPRLIDVCQIAPDSREFADSPITAAFQCSSPIVENVLDPDIGYVSYAAGVLGTRQRAGVLYLEMGDISFEASSSNTLAMFKAIRQAFCDCLKLK